jgi:hypothetical protein
MSLLETLKNWTAAQSAGLVAYTFPATQVDNPDLVAGEDYFRLWLAEMRLNHNSLWFTDWYPAVHSLVKFTFGDSTIELPRVVGSLNLPGLAPATLDSVVSLNHALTTLLPFNGGTVELSAGLLAMQGTNHVNTLIKIVGDFSALLAAPPVSTALAVAQPVIQSVSDLLTASNGGLHLGLHQTFAGGPRVANPLAAGYIALIKPAKPGAITTGSLRVEHDSLRLSGAAGSAPLPDGHDYLLFKIERRQERDDWDSLTTIQKPFAEARRALRDRNTDRAEDLIREAVLMALESPDLTRADRARTAQQVKTDFDAAKALGLGAVAARDVVQAGSLTAVMSTAMSPAQALAGPRVTFRSLFG